MLFKDLPTPQEVQSNVPAPAHYAAAQKVTSFHYALPRYAAFTPLFIVCLNLVMCNYLTYGHFCCKL
jgi:hypothetical protein